MTTISEKLTTIDNSLKAIKQAIITKGVTPSGNITTYAAAIGNISGGGSSGGYQLLERISDDSNNEIGTVSGFFTDANNTEYAVVCLDAQYRLASGTWCSNPAWTSNTYWYQNQSLYSAKETATNNNQRILDYITSQSYTTTGFSHCRSQSFTIGGVTYYGQMPNILELIDIYKVREAINTADTSASSYSSLIISNSTASWSSSQYNSMNAWHIDAGGYTKSNIVTGNCFIIPVLELPNQ